MSIIVNEIPRKMSDVNGFYRVEDYNLNGPAVANFSLSQTIARSQILSFANSGNLRGIILQISNYSTATRVTRDVILDLEEAKTISSVDVSTDFFTLNAHGLENDMKVRFTSTGTLPTNITATATYYVVNKTDNTFQIASTIGGTRINMSGTPTGTITCWVTRATSINTPDDLIGVGQVYALCGTYARPFLFDTPYAVDTTSNKWRFTVMSGAGAGTWYIVTNTAFNPFYFAWCDTAVSYSDTNDMIVSCNTLTVDMDATPKPYQFYGLASSSQPYGLCGFLCTAPKDKRGWERDMMLVFDDTKPITLNLDGMYLGASQSGIYAGFENAKRTLSNKIRVNLKRIPTFGPAGYSGFGDYGMALSYYSGGMSLCFAGEPPTKRFATLTSDVSVGANKIYVDDATGFEVGDKIYITKHNATYGTLDGTQYTISGVNGNEITFTPNLLGQGRLAETVTENGDIIPGGAVMKANGYGIEIFSDTLTGYGACHYYRGHGFSNLYLYGVHNRGNVGTNGYSTSYRFIDNDENIRADGWLIKYCLSENYNGTQSTTGSLSATLYPTHKPIIVEDNLGANTTLVTTINKFVFSPVPGEVYQTGDMYFRRNIISRNAAQLFYTHGTANARIIAEDNIGFNTLYGISVGQRNSIVRNNISYGVSIACLINSASGCVTKDNIVDRATTGVNFANAIIVTNTKITDKYTNILGFAMILANDISVDIKFENCAGNLSYIDTTLQTAMATGTKIRVLNNNKATNNDFVVQPEGIATRCGSGLGDTTEYITGGFPIRLEGYDYTLPMFWEQTVPVGNIQGKTASIGYWVKINSANYYADDYIMPRLTVDYDNGTTVYSEALKKTDWQFVKVDFTPETTYGQIKAKLEMGSNAVGSDNYVYIGSTPVFFPPGLQLNLSDLSLWADGFPITPTIATNLSAGDVWSYPNQNFGLGSVGNLVRDNLDVAVSSRSTQELLEIVGAIVETIQTRTNLIPTNPLLTNDSRLNDLADIELIKTKVDTLTNTDLTAVNKSLNSIDSRVRIVAEYQ